MLDLRRLGHGEGPTRPHRFPDLSARQRERQENPPPLLADLDCAVRGSDDHVHAEAALTRNDTAGTHPHEISKLPSARQVKTAN
jgi:hypothetical protein